MFKLFNFEKLSIVSRLVILVLLPILLTTIFGYLAFITIDNNRQTLNIVENRSDMLSLSHRLNTRVHEQVRVPITGLDSEKITWNDGLAILTESQLQLKQDFALFNANNAEALRNNDPAALAVKNAIPEFLAALTTAINIVENEKKVHLKLFIQEDMDAQMDPLINALTFFQNNDLSLSKQLVHDTAEKTSADEKLLLFLLAANLIFLLIIGYLVFRSISRQTRSLTSTIAELNSGNKKARTLIQGDHELAQLGNALNQLLDEQEHTEKYIKDENDTLNDSVFALLESVADLSERNLMVRATVTEDATGPLADAINQLASDTTDVLKKVKYIAESVESTSQTVDQRTLTVKRLAESERTEALATSTAVNDLIERLNHIADSSKSANTMAEETSQTTEKAYHSVSKTLDSMTTIRGTVQETGKRIKRLGERSQEITHIIDLINTITERTTILALNASMQALSAGEAGKGFSVIAEEIQRLAESSRESTDQIANLIKNIQQETRTTMSTMDHTIEQVVSGSSLAEEASSQMQLTLDATNKLTQSVESIAQASQEQVGISHDLYIRSTERLKTTQSTGQEMESLSNLTKNMVSDAQNLVHSVNVFTLEEVQTPKTKAA